MLLVCHSNHANDHVTGWPQPQPTPYFFADSSAADTPTERVYPPPSASTSETQGAAELEADRLRAELSIAMETIASLRAGNAAMVPRKCVIRVCNTC